jgi:ATP-binding cassette, subfamily B, bacterial HlyB/CyaB
MQTGIIALELIAKMNQRDFDGRSVSRELGLTDSEISVEELIRLAKDSDYKVKLKTFKIDEFPDKYPVPVIVIKKDGSYAVVIKIEKKKNQVLVFEPQTKQASMVPFDKFEEVADGRFIVLNYKGINQRIAFGFKWFFYEILTYKKIITEVLLGSFIVQLFGLVSPLFTQVILDKVIVHHSLVTLNILAIAFIVITVFDFVINVTRNYLFLHTACKIDSKLGAKLFKHLFALPYRYFESRKVGNIIARVRELDRIREFITNKAVSVLIDLFFSLVFVVMMFLYSVKLALVVLAIVAFIAIIYIFVTPVYRRRLEDKFEMGAQSNSYLVESVTGIETVKSMAIEGSMQRRWEDYLGKYVLSTFNLGLLGNITKGATGFLHRCLTISILFFGVKLVIVQELTIGQLIAFQMFANQFISPVLRLVTLWNEFQQALLSVDRLGDILNHPEEVVAKKAITLAKIEGSVRLENLSFRYVPDTPNAVNDFNLKIEPGTSVALVGRSGSGKSTVAKLIQRLYIANDGAIYIDDVDIKHMNAMWLRYNIGVVLQENYLFSGTIRENISLAKPDASMDEIIAVSKLASSHEFISEMPEGYDTMVGERGSTLSGGQKQRIAIARALITNPKILIFDEATSALDSESESIILGHLNKIRKGRTLIFIAHRLSTIKNCDQIVVLEKGKVVEQGTHSNLIKKKNGYYNNLYKLQEK